MSDLHRIIKQWRLYLGLTQREFADKVKCGLKSMNDWENNRCVPYQYNVRKIAKALKLDYQEFLKGPKAVESTDVDSIDLSNGNMINVSYLSPVHPLSGLSSSFEKSTVIGYRIYPATASGISSEYHFVYVDLLDFSDSTPFSTNLLIHDNPDMYDKDDMVLVWNRRSGEHSLKPHKELKKTDLLMGLVLKINV